jgi:hypothetical protein
MKKMPIPSKTLNFAKYLEKSLLGQILGEAVAARHAEAKGIDTPTVGLIQMLKSRCITGLSKADDFGLRHQSSFRPLLHEQAGCFSLSVLFDAKVNRMR